MSRLNEVEELAYLRWVNSCLRDELSNSTVNFDKASSSPNSVDEMCHSAPARNNESIEYSNEKRRDFVKKLKKWSTTNESVANFECQDDVLDKAWVQLEEGSSPRRRHSISGSKFSVEELMPSKRRQSDGFMCAMEMEKENEPHSSQIYDICVVQRSQASLDVEKRVLRIPKPPPRPSSSQTNSTKQESLDKIPQPPPPPPPPPPVPKLSAKSSTGVVQRAPQVVEFYHSLMKRDSRKESTNGGVCDVPDVANVRSSMIGEIENRSSHLLAVRAFPYSSYGSFSSSLKSSLVVLILISVVISMLPLVF